MGELCQDALRDEFRRGAEGDEQKSSGKPKFRPVADGDAWIAGFTRSHDG